MTIAYGSQADEKGTDKDTVIGRAPHYEIDGKTWVFLPMPPEPKAVSEQN